MFSKLQIGEKLIINVFSAEGKSQMFFSGDVDKKISVHEENSNLERNNISIIIFSKLRTEKCASR